MSVVSGAGLAIDGSTPARFAANATSTTSASFTAPSGALLVCCVAMDGDSGTSYSAVVSDSGGLTWTTRVARAPGESGLSGGGVLIATATTTSAASRTVTVTRSGVTRQMSAVCYVVTGQNASPIGANGENNSTTNAITPSVLTSTGANSLLFVSAIDWNANGAPTSSDLTANAANYSGLISVISGYKVLGAAGAQTANLDAAGTSAAAWTWVALEILD